MDNTEKEIVLYALDYAKDIIDFQCQELGILTHRIFPKPPLDCINDTIRMIATEKYPWES